MEDTGKISLGQLMTLLLLSRLFTIVTYTTDTNGLYPGEVGPVSILLSGVLQVAALLLGIWLSRSPVGVSPMLLGERGGKGVFRFIGSCYWLLAMAVCVYTGVSFTFFVIANFYDFALWWVVALAFILAASLAVRQGIEALSRSATIFCALMAVAFVVVLVGVREQFDILNYFYPSVSFGESAMEVYRGFAMNFELVAFLLLLPWVRDYKAPRGSAWVAWSTLAAVALQFLTTLTLGMYGTGKRFPVFTVVTTAQFVGLNRLDSVFMCIWVVLGFYKLSVFLQLAVSLFASMGFRSVKHRDIWIHSGLVAAAVLLALGLTGLTSSLYTAMGAGVLTVAGVILLPMIGWALKRKGGKTADEAKTKKDG